MTTSIAMPIAWNVSNSGYPQSDSATIVPSQELCNHSKNAIDPPPPREDAAIVQGRPAGVELRDTLRGYQAMP